MHEFSSFIMQISSACQKDKLPLCFQTFFAFHPNVIHDTIGGTFRIVISYQESIIASFEDIWQSKLSQNVDRRGS